MLEFKKDVTFSVSVFKGGSLLTLPASRPTSLAELRERQLRHLAQPLAALDAMQIALSVVRAVCKHYEALGCFPLIDKAHLYYDLTAGEATHSGKDGILSPEEVPCRLLQLLKDFFGFDENTILLDRQTQSLMASLFQAWRHNRKDSLTLGEMEAGLQAIFEGRRQEIHSMSRTAATIAFLEVGEIVRACKDPASRSALYHALYAFNQVVLIHGSADGEGQRLEDCVWARDVLAGDGIHVRSEILLYEEKNLRDAMEEYGSRMEVHLRRWFLAVVSFKDRSESGLPCLQVENTGRKARESIGRYREKLWLLAGRRAPPIEIAKFKSVWQALNEEKHRLEYKYIPEAKVDQPDSSPSEENDPLSELEEIPIEEWSPRDETVKKRIVCIESLMREMTETLPQGCKWPDRMRERPKCQNGAADVWLSEKLETLANEMFSVGWGRFFKNASQGKQNIQAIRAAHWAEATMGRSSEVLGFQVKGPQ